MINIQLLSDLHLESNPHFQPQPTPGADVLVLAGDIGSYQQGSMLALLGVSDFGLGRFANWPVPVLFVPGNHEYDGLEFEATQERLQTICQQLGIVYLEGRSIQIGPVRFIGSTLWADFDALAGLQKPLRPGAGAETLAALQRKVREKAFRAANHYLRKNHTLRLGQPMLAEAMREESLKSQAWLAQTLQNPFDGPTVVVTHFAPSLLSADPRYGIVPGTAGFCNALDTTLLPLADVWLHGHLHCPVDCLSASGCRIVANPLGYAFKDEQRGFRPDLLIEVS